MHAAYCPLVEGLIVKLWGPRSIQFNCKDEKKWFLLLEQEKYLTRLASGTTHSPSSMIQTHCLIKILYTSYTWCLCCCIWILSGIIVAWYNMEMSKWVLHAMWSTASQSTQFDSLQPLPFIMIPKNSFHSEEYDAWMNFSSLLGTP